MNSLVAALGLLHDAQPGMNARRALAFLYVCENEGLSLHELAVVSQLSDQTASRAVAALAAAEIGLLATCPDPADRRLLILELTELGRRLRDAVDVELRAARPISTAVAPPREATSRYRNTTDARRRSSVLQAVEIFRGLGAQLNLMDMLCFLVVAERRSIGLKDLTRAFAITSTMASRCIRGFLPPNQPGALPPALGFIELRTDDWDSRAHLARLNPAGERLAARLDEVIADRSTLVPDAPYARFGRL